MYDFIEMCFVRPFTQTCTVVSTWSRIDVPASSCARMDIWAVAVTPMLPAPVGHTQVTLPVPAVRVTMERVYTVTAGVSVVTYVFL